MSVVWKLWVDWLHCTQEVLDTCGQALVAATCAYDAVNGILITLRVLGDSDIRLNALLLSDNFANECNDGFYD